LLGQGMCAATGPQEHDCRNHGDRHPRRPAEPGERLPERRALDRRSRHEGDEAGGDDEETDDDVVEIELVGPARILPRVL